jgi:hypothetical protein
VKSAQEKELTALRRLLLYVNRYMWTDKTNEPKAAKVFERLVKVWTVAESRSPRI